MGLSILRNREKKRMKKNEHQSLRHMWETIKCASILIMGVPDGEEKQKKVGRIFVDNGQEFLKFDEKK